MKEQSPTSDLSCLMTSEVTLDPMEMTVPTERTEFSFPEPTEKRIIHHLNGQSFPSSLHATKNDSGRRFGNGLIRGDCKASIYRRGSMNNLETLVHWVLNDSQTKSKLDLQTYTLCNYLFKYNKNVALKHKILTTMYSVDDTDSGASGDIEIFVDVFQLAVIHGKGQALKKLLQELKKNQGDFEQVYSQNCARINVTNGTDSKKLKREDTKIDRQNILQIASQYSHTCLTILLDHHPNHSQLLFSKDPQGRNVLHLAAANKSVRCLRLLYETANQDYNFQQDNFGNTPLHYSVKDGTIETTFFILENTNRIKKYINLCNKKNKTALFYARDPRTLYLLLWYAADPTVGSSKSNGKLLQHFLAKYPDNARALLNYEITTNDKQVGDQGLLFIYNYRLFRSNGNENNEFAEQNQCTVNVPSQPEGNSRLEEIKILSSFSKNKELLNAPLAESFLHLKWLRIKTVFYFNLFIYSLFLISVSFLICGTSYMKHHYPFLRNETSNVSSCKDVHEDVFLNATQYNKKYTELFLTGWKLDFFIFFLISTILSCITISIRELLQMINGGLIYFKSFENWLEIGAISCTVTYVVIICLRAFSDVKIQDDIEHGFGAVAVFLAWLEMTLLIGRFPSIGIYSYMSTQVIRQLLKFFSVYVTTLIAFALAFNVLLPKAPVYENPLTAFLGVMVMMIGEFGFEDTFTWDNVGKYGTAGSYIITQILFVLFIFLVAIIIANLMIGLTVNDTRELFKEAGIYRLYKTLLQIQEVEKIMVNGPFFKFIRKSSFTSWLFPEKFEEHTQLFPVLQSEINKNYDIQICFKPKSSTDRIANYGELKNFKIYKYDTDKQGPSLRMSLPIWVMKNTELALAMKEKVESELNLLLDGFVLQMERESYENSSVWGTVDRRWEKKSSRASLFQLGPESGSDQLMMLEHFDTLAFEMRKIIEQNGRFSPSS